MSTVRPRSYGPLYSTGFQTSYYKCGTRGRLAADMAAFDQAGGRIEVLGNTPLRRKPAKPGENIKDAPSSPPPAADKKQP